jgi:hypothetical protein
MMKRIKQIIENKNGIMISKKYKNVYTPIKFKYNQGHDFAKIRNQLQINTFYFIKN